MKIARLLVAVPFVSSSFNNDQRRENVIAPRTFSKTLAASKSLVTFCHKSGTPGISVAVSKGGKIIYATGVGCSDVENLTKCTRDSVFRIASISKSITAVIAAKLMDQGKLDLDKNILVRFDILLFC
uniref:Beta-lactamase domain-containing protein n=1 Tax=Rhabditophanes sp. KR3021 TaxID=114890 RepID=A0AC35UFR9_9BILA